MRMWTVRFQAMGQNCTDSFRLSTSDPVVAMNWWWDMVHQKEFVDFRTGDNSVMRMKTEFISGAEVSR